MGRTGPTVKIKIAHNRLDSTDHMAKNATAATATNPDSAVYEAARKDELRDLLAEQAKLKVREGQLEETWMEALELLETLQAELEALS